MESRQYTDISRKQYRGGMATLVTAVSTGYPVLTAAHYRAFDSAERALRIPAVAEVQRRMSQQLLNPFRDAYRSVSQAREDAIRAVSPLRQVFDQLMETRRQVGSWLSKYNPFQPPKVTGLDEHLSRFRRGNVRTETARIARLRSLLVRRAQQGEAPGRTVTTKPQVTRGPNNTRKSIVSNPLTGLLDV